MSLESISASFILTILFNTLSLGGDLIDEYLDHLATLVRGVHLLGDAITHEDIECARKYFLSLCGVFTDLYSEQNETINIHELFHLREKAKDLGPMWAHSCFDGGLDHGYT